MINRLCTFCKTVAAASMLVAAAPAAADVKAGVDKWQTGNYTAAVQEWRPFAERGDADAQFNMGQAYKLGRGVLLDLAIAQSWFEKAAQQGHEQAQANLGLILFQKGEHSAAMPWIKKASDTGDPRAQYVLGTAMFNGDYVGKDWVRAYALMSRAAAAGLMQAANSLTQMEKSIPADQREKGAALAKQMAEAPVAPSPASGSAAAAKSAPAPSAPKAPATAAQKPAPQKPAAQKTAAQKPAAAPAAVAQNGGWRVQFGAFSTRSAAEAQWSSLAKRISVLSGMKPSYESAGKLVRLRAGSLPTRAAAERICASAKAAGQACFPVSP